MIRPGCIGIPGPQGRIRCPKHATDGSRYCEDHQAEGKVEQREKKENNDRARNSHTRATYGPRWEGFKKQLRAYQNVICQHVDPFTGTRCPYKVEIFHHLLPPECYPEHVCDYRNVVGVCRKHHPQDSGEPKGAKGNRYTPTLFFGTEFVEMNSVTMPGEKLLNGPHWTLESQMKAMGAKSLSERLQQAVETKPDPKRFTGRIPR